MGYWGWRPLALTVFICVWVAGCNLANDVSPSSTAPTAYPNVTLTLGRPAPPRTVTLFVTPAATPTSTTAASTPTEPPSPTPMPRLYVIQEGDTLLDIALRHGISLEALRAANAASDLTLLQVGQAIILPEPTQESPAVTQAAAHASATPMALVVQPPACYPTRVETTLCLGRVDNPQPDNAGRVVVEVRLLRPGGETPLVEIATIEQSLIPSGGFAPYRAIFETRWSDFMGASAVLLSADAALDSSIRTLSVENQRIDRVDGSFQISAELVNHADDDVQPLRAVVTLQSQSGEVIGYRVTALEGTTLPTGARLPLNLELVPQLYPDSPLSVYIYAEARGM